MRNPNRMFTGLLISFVGIGIYFAIPQILKKSSCCIIKNVSNSLPFSYFIGYRINEPTHGMYVTFEHPESEILLAKRIAGLSGDLIEIKNQQVYVNHIPYGIIQERSPSSRPLTAIQEGKIPYGYVYVYGTHPSSFDSRYAEFGLIPISQLKEQLWPLF
ncbi:MAG: S26 family signal peptidase [Chlamydiales bacterium]